MNVKRTGQILVVDDEEVIRNLVTEILQNEGYSACTARSGIEALNKLGKRTFDLALIDLKMPEMDGVELMKKVRQRYPEIVIVIMTGYATLETARAAIRQGASNYVVKPFDVNEIRLAVSNALDRFRLTQENMLLKETLSLFKVGEALGATANLENLLHLILSSALSQVGASRGSLMLVDEKGKELNIRASVGIEGKIVKEARVKIGEGIAGRVAQTAEPLLITNVREHPLFNKLSHDLPDKSFISIPLLVDKDEELLSIPLRTKKKVLGVLNLNRKTTGGVFTERDLRLLSILVNQAVISIENVQLFQNLEETYLSTMQSLILILEAKSPYTRGHSERVTEYASGIAKEMRLTSEEIDIIKRGSILHDVGKIGISDSILNKPSKLTPDEHEIVKQHPLIGSVMVKPIRFLQKAIPVIRHHHERMDGRGYPDGLTGEDLSCLERISIVADAYDAITSDRPYRKALNQQAAFNDIGKNAGTQFDEQVVTALMKTQELRNFVPV